MKFRKAQKEDIPKLFDILKENNPKYAKALALRELEEMFSNALVRPTYIVAEDKNSIVAFGGFIPSWADHCVFNIFWINTAQAHERLGIASRLLDNMINRIKKIKAIKAQLILISTRIPAYYYRFGFKRVTSKYDGDYVLMSLALR